MSEELAAAAINGAYRRRSASLLERELKTAESKKWLERTKQRRSLEMRDIQGLGRMAASIPTRYYYLAMRLHPELDPRRNRDKALRNAAWKRWLASDEAKPFLNTEKA